jgi:hypothetical protein
MARIALVDDDSGIVENVILAPESHEAPGGQAAVVDEVGVGPGDGYDGTELIRRPPEVDGKTYEWTGSEFVESGGS